jgi:predicted TPR repeat methyltransferase
MVLMRIIIFSLLLDPAATQPASDLTDKHLEIGNTALANSDFSTAISNYQSCLNLDPDHRYCLINYASALVDSIDENESEDIKIQHSTKAVDMLRRVLQSHPTDGDAAFNLAILLQDASRSEETTREAAKLYQISVEASIKTGEERWDAWANLASAQQELGIFIGQFGAHACYERSIVYLEKIVNGHRSYIDSVLHSPNAEKMEWDEAKYEEVSAELWHMNMMLSKMYYGLGTILSELSPQDCLHLMNQETLLIDAVDGQEDEEQAKNICTANAVNALRMAVNLNGDNMVAAHMLNAMVGDEGDGGSKRASNEFVEGKHGALVNVEYYVCSITHIHWRTCSIPAALFDDFADTFDDKLGALNYRVPYFIGEAAYWLLQQGGRETYRSVLDAGCGTGLAGRFLKPLVDGSLVGVDLSTKMLDVARECTLLKGCGLKEVPDDEKSQDDEAQEEDMRSSIQLYNHLTSLDLETATLDEIYLGYNDAPADAKDGFELIVAADVLVYIGDLEKLLLNFAKLSAESNEERDAFLIFSCERIEEEDAPSNGWKIQSSGRYAHSKSYVVNTAKEAGFRLISYEEIIPRMEKGEEVQGHLFQFAYGLDEEWNVDDMDTGDMVFMDIIDENGKVVLSDEL